MTDPFHSSKYSLQHAERRLIEFEREMNAFRKLDPCKYVIDIDPDTLENIHKVKLVEIIPNIFPGCGFDIVSNLRSALDQAGYAVATANGRTKGRDAHFPFGLNTNEVNSRANGPAKDIPKEIFDVMVKSAPYKGGNDYLWCLNELCNTNKHETIMIMAMGTFGWNIGRAEVNGPFSMAGPVWDHTKNEMEFARTGHGKKFNGEFQFSFFVAIGNIDVIVGQPATRVLNNMLNIVNRILMAIEGEASRIGLFS
jgi:hypothetical protein